MLDLVSVECTAVLVKAVKEGDKIHLDDHDETLAKAKITAKTQRENDDLSKAEHVVGRLPKKPRRFLERVLKENCSG